MKKRRKGRQSKRDRAASAKGAGRTRPESSDDAGRSGSTPILRWAGSKRKLITKITALFPSDYKRYIEPFAGSACVFSAIAPRQAILSDINLELMETYKTLATFPSRVGGALEAWDMKKRTYYDVRDLDPKDLGPIKRCARFIYLNRRCFNGVFRRNRNGEFNVPLGRRTGRMPATEDLKRFGKLLAVANIRACDFERSVSRAKDGDLLYLDPPYTRPGTRFRGEYGWDAFRECDEVRLVKAIRAAAKRGAHVVLSYRGSIAPRLPGWHRHHVRVLRSVSGFSEKRSRVTEVLFTSPSLKSA